MRKTLLFLILFLNINIIISAQPIRFNRMYHYTNLIGGVGTRFNQIIQRNNQYIAFGHYAPDIPGLPNNRISVIAAKFDSYGNLTNWYPYLDTMHNYMLTSWNSDTRIIDGGYIISGSAVENHTPYTNYGFLMKLDSNMNMQWRRFYNDTNPNSLWTYPDYAFQALKITPDNGFIVAGIRYKNSGVSTCMAAKYDSLGNQQWVKTYYENYYWSVLYNIEILPDGSFLFGGGISPTADNNTVDDIIIKTDSAGNIIWQKIIGGTTLDGHIFLQNLPDNNIMVFMAKGDSAIISQGNYKPYNKLQFYKISPFTGDTIWSMSFGSIKYNQISYAFRVFSDGSALASGSYGIAYNNPWLLHFDREGSVDWYKEYRNTYPVITYFNNPIYDLQQTSDSGFIVSGELYIHDSVHAACGWLMKIDKNGNWQDSANYIMPNIKMESSLEVFPNPASTEVTATYFSDIEQGILEIYNTMGTKVMEVKLPKGQSSYTFSVTHLAKGYYKVILKEKGYLRGQVSLLITN